MFQAVVIRPTIIQLVMVLLHNNRHHTKEAISLVIPLHLHHMVIRVVVAVVQVVAVVEVEEIVSTLATVSKVLGEDMDNSQVVTEVNRVVMEIKAMVVCFFFIEVVMKIGIKTKTYQ